LGVSLLGKSGTFLEGLAVGQLGLEVVDTVQELASLAVHANTIAVELGAELGHEVAWEMGLLLELVSTVCVRAGVTELAAAVHLEVSAQLGLLLALVLLFELVSFLSGGELLLLCSSGGFAVLKSLSYQEVSIGVFGVIIEAAVVFMVGTTIAVMMVVAV